MLRGPRLNDLLFDTASCRLDESRRRQRLPLVIAEIVAVPIGCDRTIRAIDPDGCAQPDLRRVDRLGEFAAFVQLFQNVAPADELAVDVRLRDRLPAAVGFERLSVLV